jgi:DNA-binding MarR family transcriptional regulator
MGASEQKLGLRRELVFQLIETSRLLHLYVDERARKAGTTRAQWSVLGRLRREEGITQADLAGRLELQPISLVRLIDRLVDQGLVERRIDPADRRAWRLFLTVEGHRMVSDLDPVGHAIREEILEGLADDDMHRVSEMLSNMKNRLKDLTRADHEHVREAPQNVPVEAVGRSPKLRKRLR